MFLDTYTRVRLIACNNWLIIHRFGESINIKQPCRSTPCNISFGVNVVEDFKEYTLRDYYCWLKIYSCRYKLKLLDNAADSRLRLIEQSAAADEKMKK
uniref:Uncharacterized protein n=1 Tax=Tanacetum cinerariifolium TaxID=118510 RepID=A0A699QM51_TANCI|nr:hypothetical protein [Tanacetum cinerariifolium]